MSTALFCPLAVDWNAVGTWVGGIGTIAAVFFAYWAGRRESRAKEKENRKRAAMLLAFHGAELRRLYTQLRNHQRQLAKTPQHLTLSVESAEYKKLLDEIRVIRSPRLDQLIDIGIYLDEPLSLALGKALGSVASMELLVETMESLQGRVVWNDPYTMKIIDDAVGNLKAVLEHGNLYKIG